MNFNIDTFIFISFLVINLTVGLFYSLRIKTLRDYAIGDRNFSTATIAATIVATWISGSFFTVHISETYKAGLWYFVVGLGDVFVLLVIGCVFGPRMKEFFGSLSVAEVMGNLYGKRIRIITAIASIAQAIGITAIQIKVFSTIFSHFLHFPSLEATLLSSFVVIIYSAFGGIRAVTFTDFIQFFTFGTFIPVFAIFIWQAFSTPELISDTLQNNPIFDYRELLNYDNPKFWPYLFLLLFYLIPSFNSAMFQRTLMAKNTQQIYRSFSIAALVCLFIHIFACFIGFAVLAHNPNLEPNNVAMYVIDNYSFSGLKGFAIIGIMAMVMSTVDSYINSASVIFSHDFCKPLGIEIKSELFLSRVFAIFIGTGAILLSLGAKDLLKLILLQANFYRPIVTVPLILAILGFRSTPKAVGLGMATGVLGAIIWQVTITRVTGIDSVIPAMGMNLIAFLGAHYLLKQPGGWIKNKENLELKELRRQKKKSK